MSSNSSEIQNFTKLYDDYAGVVRSVLFRFCAGQDLDDLVQETFVKIWRGLDHFQERSSLKTWVCRIAYYTAVDHLRKKKVSWQEWLDGHGVSEAQHEQKDQQKHLYRALMKLDDKHRDVVLLCQFEEMTLQEASEVLEISLGTVKSRLHHAKKKLFEILKQQGVQL